MPTYSTHGGYCCGAGHLRGFDSSIERNPKRLLAAQAKIERFRMTEIILNGSQIMTRPRVLEEMANLGYVLVGRYINGNHSSNNYVFHRCDNRLPLTNPDGTCVIPNWTGHIIHPRLSGELSRISIHTSNYIKERLVRPTVQWTEDRPHPAVDSRVVWNGVRGGLPNNSGYDGTIRPVGSLGTLRQVGETRNTYFIQWDDLFDPVSDGGGSPVYYVNRNQFTVLSDEEAQANPRIESEPLPDIITKHAEPLNYRDVPTVVLSTYHNVYRGGRRGAGYDTFYETRQSRRIEGRIDRRDVYSNGDIVWVNEVTE